MTGIPRSSRRAVAQRSQEVCERCSRPLFGIIADIHHRRPRGMGGTSNPAIHEPANLLALCRSCHRWVEEHRTEALEQGWLISQHDPRAPEEVPIYAEAAWWVIDDEWHEYDFSVPF